MPSSEMGLDHNSNVWRNAEWSADITKMAQALELKQSEQLLGGAEMKETYTKTAYSLATDHNHIHFSSQ